MLTTWRAAAGSRSTSAAGGISGCPSRPSSSRAARFISAVRLNPNADRSWPRKMFIATDSPPTRSSSW